MAEENGTKSSKQESIKEQSNYLLGNITQELADENPYVSDESYELLKFHGSYQGYDRDTATERKKAGLEKEWEFMLRMKCPAGRLTAKQYLAIDEICEKYANGSMRITTRQTFQFHCIIKENLKRHISALNDIMISTLGGCGDVVRNVMCTAAPIKDTKHEKILADTLLIAEHCAPKTTSYRALWVDDDGSVKQQADEDEFKVEPLYGKFYLPRKFKIGLGVPEDNSLDVLTHDLAIVLIYEGEEFKGYNLCLGGGLGMTHNKPATYPRLATPIAFIEPNDLLRGVEAVVKLTRDHGDRSNRKHARLKYVVEENGIEWTRTTLEEYFGEKMQDPKPVNEYKVVDHMGWHEQKDGKYYLGIPVDSGRIIDNEDTNIRSVLRDIITKYNMGVTLTADQNIILRDIEESDKQDIENTLRNNNIKLREDISDAHRFFLACVALPTCGKALAEAERIKLPLVKTIEEVMEKNGILQEKIAIRITGCPNGCARPYVGDIGIVGRTPDHYAIYIGGDFEGTRLNTKILDRVPYDNLGELFDIMFAKYANEKNDNEGFGDFVHRIGSDKVIGKVVDDLGEKYKWAKAA